MTAKSGRWIVILMLAAAFLGGYLMRAALLWVTSENTLESASAFKVNDPAIKQYAEALAQIKQRGVFTEPIGDLRDMVASSLKVYLAQKDPYSDFLTSEEYAKFKAAGKQYYAGLGIDVEKRRNGDIICYPVPKGPAALAGIKPGERLLALNGISTRGKSLLAIVTLAAGQAGTDVVVKLEDLSGNSRQVTVTRSPVAAPAVSDYSFRSARIIKLSSFTPNTRQELDYLLSGWHKSKPIIIDLRGCGGGDFYAAVDSAMLFLKKGEQIISVREHSETRLYSSTTARQPPTQRVFLWQDEFTASAAEIFVAALTENMRGTSIGRTSAGKGTRQDIIDLQDGAALIMTTGYLITPRGVQFDGQGLTPMYPIKEGEHDTEAFFNKTAALIN